MRFAMRDWGMREAVSGVRFEVSDFDFAQSAKAEHCHFERREKSFLDLS
jgi:hypothetical protein